VNTILLSLDKYPEDYTLNKRVEIINLALSLVFFIEMLIKMIGLGCRGYFFDGYNIFDAFIVALTAIDIISSNVT
jgi:hypothetical protein